MAWHQQRLSAEEPPKNFSALEKSVQVKQSAWSTSSVPGPPSAPVWLADIIVRNQICPCTIWALHHLSFPQQRLVQLASSVRLSEGALKAPLPPSHLPTVASPNLCMYETKENITLYLCSNKPLCFFSLLPSECKHALALFSLSCEPRASHNSPHSHTCCKVTVALVCFFTLAEVAKYWQNIFGADNLADHAEDFPSVEGN